MYYTMTWIKRYKDKRLEEQTVRNIHLVNIVIA